MLEMLRKGFDQAEASCGGAPMGAIASETKVESSDPGSLHLSCQYKLIFTGRYVMVQEFLLFPPVSSCPLGKRGFACARTAFSVELVAG